MALFDTTTSDAVPRLRRAEEPAFAALVRFFPSVAVHRLPRSGALTVGRRPDAGLVVAHRQASREHAAVHVTPDGPVLHDLGSHNGTFVGGQRVEGERVLRDGDVVRVGGVLFVYRARARAVAETVHDPVGRYGMVGPVHLRAVWRAIEDGAGSGLRVLVLGETGTGKELVARAVAAASRPEGAFVALNVAAVPRELFEAELFGHRRGAFSGATEARRGAFRSADGGVLFLDEVGDLSGECQVKLLRVLEERAVRPVGSDRATPVDVRVVSATERPLREMVMEGSFRASLYNRLREVEVRLPPLRERTEDLPSLVAHLLARTEGAGTVAPEELDPEALEVLACHPLPGNVRELAAVLHEATRVAGSPGLDAATVRAALAARTLAPPPRAQSTMPSSTTSPASPSLSAPELAEREVLLRALTAHAFNVRRTAESLGRPRSYVYRAVRRLGIALGEGRRGRP